jgi:hypothetical protein
MSFMISLKEVAAFRKMAEEDPWLNSLWEIMQLRVTDHTSIPGISQPNDTQEWWHLVEERIYDVAFTWHVTRDKSLGTWLHDTIQDICARSADEWVGPWFRPRKNPPVGQLETAHICAAVSTALDLAGELFSPEETESIKADLRIKGLEACERFLEEKKNTLKMNWNMVLLDGYTSAAAVLGDKGALVRAKEEYRDLEKLYNADSYGESIQYWNYASLKMSHTYEILLRFDPALVKGLTLPYVKCIPWFCSSLMFLQPLGGDFGDKPWARVVNYGDAALTTRISGDTALHIARRAKDICPREAGLARWVFEYVYRDAELRSNERATFGFINNFSFYTLIHYPHAVRALNPDEAKLPLVSSFEVGHIIIRDSFQSPKTIVSTLGGYQPLGTTAHRHQDLNSFILAHLGEIFFADPGHCCYRTRTHKFTMSGESHSNWRFQTEDGGWIDQIMVSRENLREPLCVRRFLENSGSITATASDAAKAYGGCIKKAERLLVSVLPHVLFIADTIEAEKPIKVQANFVTNNRDNKLKYHAAAPTKLVLRRNHAALNFFQSFAEPACDFSFSWTSLHDCYHPLPNQAGQGKEGSGVIFTQTSAAFSLKHRMVYVIVMAEESAIKGWHIFTNETGVFEVEAPQGIYRIRFEETPGGFTVKNGKTGEEFHYCRDEMEHTP